MSGVFWWICIGGYGALSLVTLGFFAWDKHRAGTGGRRVPEATLHTLELLGGWPGALLGMQLFKHKRKKPSFWAVTILIVLLHAGAWALGWWLLERG